MIDPAHWTPDETPTHLYSPLTKDLTITLFNDDNTPDVLTIHSLELVTFPRWKALIVKKHIVDALINERNLGYLSPEKRQELEREVEVTL